MSIAVIKTNCAYCGKDIFDQKTIVVLSDMQWIRPDAGRKRLGTPDPGSRVKFASGNDTRNAYCNVTCLKSDLNETFESLESFAIINRVKHKNQLN